MIVRLTRKAAFSSGHSYYLPTLSHEENQQIFGQHASDQGHGHNYSLSVTVSGPVDPKTGIVVNITQIDKALKQNVVSELDGRFLNREVPFFESNPPSTENLVYFALENLKPKLPKEVTLTSLSVAESDRLWSSWSVQNRPGENNSGTSETMNEVSLTRKYDFSAAHRLHSNQLSPEENLEIFGKCNHPNFHGHNYEIEVTIAGRPDKRSGMLYDLDKLDKIAHENVVDPMDHRNLNLDIEEFETLNPTSEMLAVVIWNRLKTQLPTEGSPRLAKVLVRETARNEFEYSGE